MVALSTLRILQQNVNKSHTAQLDLICTASPVDFHIITMQELYLDHFKNTRASAHRRGVYPAVMDPNTALRSTHKQKHIQ